MKKFFNQAKALLIRKKQPLITTALLTCVVVSYQNCQQKGEFFEKVSMGAAIEPPIESITQPPSNEGDDTPLCQDGSSDDLICNPLGGGGGGTQPPYEPPSVPKSKLGLIANLYEGQNNWNDIDRYYSDGYKHPENIYFSNFNVPTHAFDEGFGYGDDDYLKNQKGEKLIEWFALQARGHITLPESETGGSYHIATLSDDGVRVKVAGRVILNNPNTHGATIDCASELIQLNKGEEKDFELSYFQGPRYHIALITMIKKIDDPDNFQKSRNCSTGNSYENLISEGYKVIGPSWFTLPADF